MSDDTAVTIEGLGQKIETTTGGMKRAVERLKQAGRKGKREKQKRLPNAVDLGGSAGERLRGFIERIERLEEEKRALAGDIREIYAEAKALGFEPKIMRLIIKERRLDQAERDEREALLDTYKHALGMLPERPANTADLFVKGLN